MKPAAFRQILQRSRCGFSTTTVLNAGFSENERLLSERLHKRQEEDAPWFLRVFASLSKKAENRFLYDPTKITMATLRAWREQHEYNADILSQSFIEERHEILGSDLACANFIVFRQGKVKFVGDDKWIEKDPSAKECADLPAQFDASYYVEAIDASNTGIRYEGLANFVNLSQLKWLSFRNCPHIDDWFVDRLTCVLASEPKIEHLDLSNCQGLTENMLSCIYRVPHLKRLVLEGVAETPAFKLGCLELEDAMPDLEIIGVDYSLQKVEELPKNETHIVSQDTAAAS